MNLHNYQKEALAFILKNQRCALFMEMGLGKTLVSLVAIHFWLKSNKAKKILLIAPLRVCLNTWPKEIEKWKDSVPLGITYSLIIGSPKKREQALKEDVDLYIINRDNIKWLIERLYVWPYDTLIIDESSSFKSSSSIRFKLLRKVIGACDNILLLSGTPICNSLLDIWSQVFLLDSGKRLFKTFYSYRQEYFYTDKFGFKWAPHSSSNHIVTQKISDICLTIKSEGNIELPDIIHNNVYCRLSDSLISQYESLEKQFILHLESHKTKSIYATSAGVLYNKLLQFCSGSIYINTENGTRATDYETIHTIKMDALEEIIEINKGKNILLSFLFKFEKEKIKERFPKAVSIDEPDSIDRWNRREVSLLIAHPQSAGHGLNLQNGGDVIVWFSMPWSLELYSQFNARLYRQGQKEKVFIHHIVMQNTIDELVQERLKDKQLTLETFLDRLKNRNYSGEK